MNSKDNPMPLRKLKEILGLPVYDSKRAAYKAAKNRTAEEKKRIADTLNKYKVGKYKEWEGDGYFKVDLYCKDGIYYA